MKVNDGRKGRTEGREVPFFHSPFPPFLSSFFLFFRPLIPCFLSLFLHSVAFRRIPSNGRTNERTNELTNERTNERKNERTNERTDLLVSCCVCMYVLYLSPFSRSLPIRHPPFSCSPRICHPLALPMRHPLVSRSPPARHLFVNRP